MHQSILIITKNNVPKDNETDYTHAFNMDLPDRQTDRQTGRSIFD